MMERVFIGFSFQNSKHILFCFFIYSDLFSYLIYSLSKSEELKGKAKFANISVKAVKLAMENVHSFF